MCSCSERNRIRRLFSTICCSALLKVDWTADASAIECRYPGMAKPSCAHDIRVNAYKKKGLPLVRKRAFLQNRTTVRFMACSIPTLNMSATFVPSDDAERDEGGMRPLLKGQQTRAAILDAALGLASLKGLEGLSIGVLADAMQMSKSGVFAHFGSREELQMSVVREYHRRFKEEVFAPAVLEPRGLPRLRALFERWVRRVSVEIDSGCLYISGAVEFDDRPGPVRDALASMVQAWQSSLERAIRLAVAEGHLQAEVDPAQLLFELHGLILALHHDARFLRNPHAIARARKAFERLVHQSATPDGLQCIAPQKRASVLPKPGSRPPRH